MPDEVKEVKSVTFPFPLPEIDTDHLLEVGKTVSVTALDAALVSLDQHVNQFHTNPMYQAFMHMAIDYARTALRDGTKPANDKVKVWGQGALEAVKAHVPVAQKAEEDKGAKVG